MSTTKKFYAFRLEENVKTFSHHQQDDYYTITLLNDTPGAGATLYFRNPHAEESLPAHATGFSCMFNDAFLSAKMQDILTILPMFRKGTVPVYFLNPKQNKILRELFDKMLEEVNNHYTFKYELLGNYLAEIIHHALKLQSSTSLEQKS